MNGLGLTSLIPEGSTFQSTGTIAAAAILGQLPVTTWNQLSEGSLASCGAVAGIQSFCKQPTLV